MADNFLTKLGSLTQQTDIARSTKSRRGGIEGGTLVSVSIPASGSASVGHGLGRVPQGWIVVNVDNSARLYASSMTSTAITLVQTDASPVNVTLWVF